MHWNSISDTEAVRDLISRSSGQPLLLFKHSTRCSISSMALSRLERAWDSEAAKKIEPYLINVLSERPISRAIAEVLHIEHESPQALIIKDGKCIYNASHSEIRLEYILDHLG